MRGFSVALAVAAILAVGYQGVATQPAAGPKEPFKLGTFERSGQAFLGVVLKDTQVIDLAQANAALERGGASLPKVQIPGDMKVLIEKYDAGLKDRIYAIVNTVSGAASAPSYVYAIKDLKVLPPVRPAVILNAGGNYREHEQGIAAQAARAARPRRCLRAGGGGSGPCACGGVGARHLGAQGRATRARTRTCSSSRRRSWSAPTIRSRCRSAATASISSASSTR